MHASKCTEKTQGWDRGKSKLGGGARGTKAREGVRDGERSFRHGDRDHLDPLFTAIMNIDYTHTNTFGVVGIRFSSITETQSSVEMSLVG